MKKSFILYLLILAFRLNSQINSVDTLQAINPVTKTETTALPDTSRLQERIQVIQHMLDQSAKGVDGWWYGWLGAYSAATVGQGVVYLASNDQAIRQDMALGAGTTLLGAVFQLITPLSTGSDAKALAAMPETTNEEKFRKLQAAEAYLKNNAMKEQEGRSWKIHALNSSVNLASGLITWLGFKRSIWDGVANFLMNTAITELQIWTQPTRTLRDYKKYTSTYLNQNAGRTDDQQAEIILRSYPGGVAVAVRF